MFKSLNEIIGERLKKARFLQNETQKEFAEALHLDVRIYGRYERGQRELPINVLRAVVDRTGVSPNYILGLQDSVKDEDRGFVNHYGFSSNSLKMADDNRDLSDFLNAVLENSEFWYYLFMADIAIKCANGPNPDNYVNVLHAQNNADSCAHRLWLSLVAHDARTMKLLDNGYIKYEFERERSEAKRRDDNGAL